MRFVPAAALALLLAACQSSPDEAVEPRFKTPDKGAYTAQSAKAPPSQAGGGGQGAPQTAKVTVQDDLFNKRTNYFTNTLSVRDLDVQTSWRLTGQKSHDGAKPTYRLRFYTTYRSSHWNDYKNANDERLAPLEVVQVDRSTANCDLIKIDCTYSETLDIVLTIPQLRDGWTGDLVITVTPSSARGLTVTIPTQYVHALLEKMA